MGAIPARKMLCSHLVPLSPAPYQTFIYRPDAPIEQRHLGLVGFNASTEIPPLSEKVTIQPTSRTNTY